MIEEYINNSIEDLENPNLIVEETDESDLVEDIVHPFDASRIDIRPMNISLEALVRRLRQERINLYPEYQRLPGLWDKRRMSQLIESLLIRIPIPVFYFDGTQDTWEVVDGLQRLSTLKRFMIDSDSLRLEGLEYLREYEGKTFNELPPFLQNRIENTQLMLYVINPGTPEEIKFNIFSRINRGGLILTAQEIRNALNQGIPARFTSSLAELDSFKEATCWSISPVRMEDRDFVTRFISFYDDYLTYESDLDAYLNRGLSMLKRKNVNELQYIEQSFDRAMTFMCDVFGNDAFRKRYDEDDRRKPINKALFDTWSVNLAKLDEADLRILRLRHTRLKNGFIDLMNNIEFDTSVTRSTGSKRAVRTRFEGIAQLISQTLQD